jgi:LacI family transcriptional regulator, repressor for deo operon, udp, cdd, tsx, nupC, and nupG
MASASMEDVAARAGVSVSTVSRALRGSSLVSEQTRLRVQAAADELSFAVSRAASSLATGRLGRIAVLLGGHLGPWFNGTVLDGMYDRFRGAELDLLVYRITDLAERRAFFERLPARRNADAMVGGGVIRADPGGARASGGAVDARGVSQPGHRRKAERVDQ